jgi:hypothetical protein
MNEIDFINNNSQFISWITTKIYTQTDDVLHSWTSSGHHSVGLKKNIKWACNSIWDAYNKYYWGSIDPDSLERISSIEQTEVCLDKLSKRLSHSLCNESAEPLIVTCEKVLEWGGVKRNKRIASFLRYELLTDSQRQMYLKGCINHLTNQMHNLDGNDCVSVDGVLYPLQLDSGTTKIFSLIVPGFIIYDSRVGCALGILASRWIQETSIDIIPDDLRFAWGSGSRSTNRNVNSLLSAKVNYFPKMPRGPSRLEMNIKASWLCKQLALSAETLSSDKFALIPFQNRVRAIEAALFMIGYSIN